MIIFFFFFERDKHSLINSDLLLTLSEANNYQTRKKRKKEAQLEMMLFQLELLDKTTKKTRHISLYVFEMFLVQ